MFFFPQKTYTLYRYLKKSLKLQHTSNMHAQAEHAEAEVSM